MKYSENFIRDITWYLKVRHEFSFDGSIEREVKFNKKGIDGIKAFHIFDSQGKLVETKHPNILKTILKTKGSVNLHIKMYAEDRAKGILPKIEFEKICQQLDPPQWFIDAVEKQKYKYY